jgi:hypothetical protein
LGPVFSAQGQCERDGNKNYNDSFGHISMLSQTEKMHNNRRRSLPYRRRHQPAMPCVQSSVRSEIFAHAPAKTSQRRRGGIPPCNGAVSAPIFRSIASHRPTLQMPLPIKPLA